MAARGFSASTLEANWFEDRAEPLAFGVFGDFGFRERGTTSKSDFRSPSEHREHSVKRTRGPGVLRFGMVTLDTLNEARLSYGTGENVGHHFGATIKTHKPDAVSGTYDTEARSAFRREGFAAAAASETHFERLERVSAKAVPAGGAGGATIEKGRATSGAIGEKLRTDGPPAERTAVQRTWLPGRDPGLAIREVPRSEAPDASFLSLRIDGTSSGVVRAAPLADGRAPPGAATAAWRAPGRTSLITGDPDKRGGRRVFADDP